MSLPLPAMSALTLVCCPLLALPEFCSQLLLADSLHRPVTHGFVSGLPHPLRQLGVPHRLRRAVRAANGSGDVTLHLGCCQSGRSPASLFALQRRWSAIPTAEPAADDLLSSLHSMAASECGEGMSHGVRSILKEDCMLGFGVELLHRVPQQDGGRRVRQRRDSKCARGFSQAHTSIASGAQQSRDSNKRHIVGV